MKRELLCMLLAGAMTAGCGGQGTNRQVAEAAPAVQAQRGLMQAAIVEKGPPIDGTLESPIWQKCPPLTLGECTTERPGPMKTTARVLFDATHLYVAWQCEEPDTAGLKQDADQRDGDVWKDDSVELFVTGDSRRGYFHFAINPRGTLYDARSSSSKRDDTSYDADAVVKTSIEPGKQWTATLSVPLNELAAYVGDDQTWVVNLNRTRPARGQLGLTEWSWAVMGSNDYHQVLDYGQIKGVNIPKRDDGVTRTATKPPPPAQYDRGKKAGSVTVYHHWPEMTVPDRGEGTAKTIELRIRGSEGLKIAFLARGTGGVDRVSFNMFDKRSNDNTTPKAYCTVSEDWKPLVYRCDRFRYNAVANSTVSRNTDYSNLRFHGNRTEGKGALELRDFTIYRGEDTNAPAAPEDLKADSGDEGVKLTWKPGADNVGIALYAISRSGPDGKFVKIGESHLPEYLDTPPAAGRYSYRVLAVDFQDNVGAWSETASVRAAKGFPQPEPTALVKDRLGYAAHVRAIHEAGKGKVVRNLVLCFGDSITGATNYPLYTQASLGRYAVEAIGRAGWRTGQGRKVIDGDLDKVKPQFCLIMYGTNNNKAEKALPQAMDDLLAIAKSCENHGTIPIIATIPPRGFRDPQSKPEARFNEALIKTCRENKIPIAYVFEAFQAGGDRRKLLAGDGVHLVSGGWGVTGPAWAEAMKQVNFVLLDRP